jgi:hypothetical protein
MPKLELDDWSGFGNSMAAKRRKKTQNARPFLKTPKPTCAFQSCAFSRLFVAESSLSVLVVVSPRCESCATFRYRQTNDERNLYTRMTKGTGIRPECSVEQSAGVGDSALWIGNL